jgi:hypothetical protein
MLRLARAALLRLLPPGRQAVRDPRRSRRVRFQPNSIVDCITESLLAPQVAFRRLHRDLADQRILGRSIAAEIALHSREAGEGIRENTAMKKLATQFNSVTLAFLREV